MVTQIANLTRGLFVLVALGLVAKFTSEIASVNYLILAILIGFIIGNITEIPASIQSGITTYKLWLETGIVLLGAQLVLSQLLEVGAVILLLIIINLIFILIVTERVGQQFGLDSTICTLLSAGIGICGVSAVVAVSQGIKAAEEDVAYIVGTILLFDALTIVIYPTVGTHFEIDATIYGIWAGITMFSTGPVTAAGFAHSGDAGAWAVLTKMARNSLLGGVVIYYSVSLREKGDHDLQSFFQDIWANLPKFIVGFVILALLVSLGRLKSDTITSLESASQWMFLFAFVGLGFQINLQKIRETGFTPIIVTTIVFVFVSILTLFVLTAIF